MLSLDELQSLEPGDLIEAGTVLDGMTKEPLRLMVDQRSPLGQQLALELSGSYFGVAVGRWRVTVGEDGKARWLLVDGLEWPSMGGEAAP